MKEYYYDWVWELDSSPERLWPYAADTNRFNQDTGLPSLEKASSGDERLINARRKLRFRRLGVPIEWEEEPFEWIYPHRFGVLRRYSRGPVREMRVLVDLIPQDEGGTRLRYQVWVSPSGWPGLIKRQLRPRSRRSRLSVIYLRKKRSGLARRFP